MRGLLTIECEGTDAVPEKWREAVGKEIQDLLDNKGIVGSFTRLQ